MNRPGGTDMRRTAAARLRVLLLASAAPVAAACGPGVDAGEDGGLAFIILAVFLVVGGIILYIAIGRED
jgi:hypothetical protein